MLCKVEENEIVSQKENYMDNESTYIEHIEYFTGQEWIKIAIRPQFHTMYALQAQIEKSLKQNIVSKNLYFNLCGFDGSWRSNANKVISSLSRSDKSQ